MREIFQLICKVVGLGFVCGGLILVLNALHHFFGGSSNEQLVRSVLSPFQALLQQQGELQPFVEAERNPFLRSVVISLVFHGLIPILFGMYLMKSSNTFVSRCYPDLKATDQQRSERALATQPCEDPVGGSTAEANSTTSSTNAESDLKYAPPGYGS